MAFGHASAACNKQQAAVRSRPPQNLPEPQGGFAHWDHWVHPSRPQAGPTRRQQTPPGPRPPFPNPGGPRELLRGTSRIFRPQNMKTLRGELKQVLGTRTPFFGGRGVYLAGPPFPNTKGARLEGPKGPQGRPKSAQRAPQSRPISKKSASRPSF